MTPNIDYVVEIRKNATGEIRLQLTDGAWDEGSAFFWTDGNFGCDCNRDLLFERATGNEPEADMDCGEVAYHIRVTLPDGAEPINEFGDK